jgi:hypothetical protein
MSQRRRGKGGGAGNAPQPLPPPPPPVAVAAQGAGASAAASAPNAPEATGALIRECQTALSGTKRNVTKALKRASALVAANPGCSFAHRTLVLTHLSLAEDFSGDAEKKEHAAAVAAAHAAVEACPRCLHCRYVRVHALFSLAQSVSTDKSLLFEVRQAARDAHEAARTLQCGEPVLEQELIFFLEKTGPAVWKVMYELQLRRCARALTPRTPDKQKPLPKPCAMQQLRSCVRTVS